MSIITISVRKLRPHLAEIIKKASGNFDRFIITKRGKPEAVIMSIDDYESLIETLNIQTDKECMKRLRAAEKELKQGKGKSLDEIRKELCLV